MSDLKEHLDEYLDGLLGEEENREMEGALAADPVLREELERGRRFKGLLGDLREEELAVRRVLAQVRRGERRQGRLLRWVAASAAAAAALLVWHFAGSRPAHDEGVKEDLLAEARTFGRRLGEIAVVRRDGRMPRRGIGDLEFPSQSAYGVVFEAALARLGVEIEPEPLEMAKNLVKSHHLLLRGLPDDLDSECRRAESSLELYRSLRNVAGRAVADAYYDVFRPGLATLRTVRRVQPGSLDFVVRNEVSPEAAEQYERAYGEAIRLLDRRYGTEKVALVLGRMAPEDQRLALRDASQDGVGPDAVLSIRAQLYRAACDAGLDKLYLAPSG